MQPPAYLIVARPLEAPPIDGADLLRLERELQAKTGIANIVFLPPGMFVTHVRDVEPQEDGEDWKA